jgi:hypothetical protein
MLVGPGPLGFVRLDLFRNDEQPLQTNHDGALKADRVLAMKPPKEEGRKD